MAERAPAHLADAADRRGVRLARLLERRDAHLRAGGKRCPVCAQRKPLSEWGRDRAQPDGLASRCKACRKRRMPPSTGRS